MTVWMPTQEEVDRATARIDRIEVVGPGGREFVAYYSDSGVILSLQDDGRTLKIFVGERIR
jgi:hypothetical protein